MFMYPVLRSQSSHEVLNYLRSWLRDCVLFGQIAMTTYLVGITQEVPGTERVHISWVRSLVVDSLEILKWKAEK